MKYFWSDLHLGEENVCKVGNRSKIFSSQQDWEEMCITSLCSNLKKGDLLYLLGDIATESTMFKFKSSLPKGVKTFLIKGNHDPSINVCKTFFGEHFVEEVKTISISGHTCVLSHFPILYWHQCHRGSLHLHGHLHDQKTDLIMSLFPDIRMLDVCPESSYRQLGEYRPFNENDILDILLERTGHDNVYGIDIRNF